MSLRQKILSEIKSLLNEDIFSITPSNHQNYLRQLAQWANERGLRANPDSLISMMDNDLRKGISTKTVYDKMFREYPMLKGFTTQPPPDYTYGGASATPGVKTMGSRPIGGGESQRRIWCSGAKQTLADKNATPEQKEKAKQDIKTYKCDQTGQAGGVGAKKTYFRCTTPEDIEATINFQKTKGIPNPNGNIGKKTYKAILLDDTIKSAGSTFIEKNISLSDLLGNTEKASVAKVYQKSVCSALGKTKAAWITGGTISGPQAKAAGMDLTSYGDGDVNAKRKCPSYIKQDGPYSFEEILGYVPNFMKFDATKDSYQEKLNDPVVIKVANTVRNALNNMKGGDCEQVVNLIKKAVSTGGRGIPGLSDMIKSRTDSPALVGGGNLDDLQYARNAAIAGTTLEQLKQDNPEAYAAAVKYGVYNPKSPNYVKPGIKLEESKNWLDRTREETTSSLFERLVKDAAKKVL